MANYRLSLSDTWVQIANNVPYLVQNRGNIPVLIQSNDSTPTDDNLSFYLPSSQTISDSVLDGVVWVKSWNGKTAEIVYKV